MTTHLSTLRDYVRLMFRWRLALFIPILLSLIVAVPVVANMKPRYTAFALVRRENNSLARSADSALVAKGATALSMKSLRVEVLTYSNLKKVIKELNLRPDLETDEELFPYYNELRKHISIALAASTGGSSGIQHIRISGSFEDPDRARDIVNTIARNYRDEARKMAQAHAKQAVEFNEQNERKYKKDLIEKEAEIDRYKEKYFATLPEVKSGILSQQVTLERDLSAYELLLAQVRTKLLEIENQLKSEPKTVSDITSAENPAMVDLQKELSAYQKGLDAMLEEVTEEFQMVKDYRKKIASLERQIEETPERITDVETVRVNPVYQELLKARLESQQTAKQQEVAIKQTKAALMALNEQKQKVVEEESTYNELVREKREIEDKYAGWQRSLTRVRGLLATEEDDNATTVTIVQQAIRPSGQDVMHRVKMLFAFIGAGFGIGVSLMFGLDFGDQSFRGVDDAAVFLRSKNKNESVQILGSVCEIVSEEELKARRRRAWAAKILLILIVGVCAICFVYFLYVQPQFVG